MTTYFISRHQGAIDWIQQQGIIIDVWQTHFETNSVKAGDTVIGTLPINLVNQVNKQGGRYLHLKLALPAEKRGMELSAEDMQECHAQLIEYQVRAVA